MASFLSLCTSICFMSWDSIRKNATPSSPRMHPISPLTTSESIALETLASSLVSAAS